MAVTYYFEFVLTDPSDPDADPVVREVISASDTVEFIPLEEDFGKELTVRLTVANQFGSSFQEQELGRIIDAFAAIVISGGTFTGSPRVNSTVTVTPIYSGGNPETPVIQYNFVDDTGASLQDSTSSSYTMTPDDLGKQLSVIMKITDIDGRESNEFFLPIGLIADEFSNPVINFITVTGAARLGNTVTVTNVDYAGGNPDNPVFEYEFVSRALDGTEQSLQLSDEASYDIPGFTPDSEEDDELLGKRLLVRVKVIDVDGRESNIETESLGVIDDLDTPAIESLEFTGLPVKLGNTIEITEVNYTGGNQNDPPSINYKFFVDDVQQTSDGSSYEIPVDSGLIGKIFSVEVQVTDFDGRESQPYTSKLGQILDQYTAPEITFVSVDGVAVLGTTVTVTNVNYSGGNPSNPTVEYRFVARDSNANEETLQLSDNPSYEIPGFTPDSEEDDELLGKRLLVRVKVIDVDGRESNIETESLGVIDDLDTPAIESLEFTGLPVKLGNTIEITEVNYTGGNQNDPPSINYKFFVDDVQQTSDGSSYEIPVDSGLIGKIFSVEVQVTDFDGRESQPYTSKLGQILDQYTAPEITFVSVDGVAVLGTTVTVTNVNYSGGNPSNPTVEYRFVARDSNANEETLQLSDNPSYEIPGFTPDSELLGKRLLVDTKITDTDGRVSNTFRVNKGIISDAYDPITIQSIDIDGNLYPGQTITATINYTGGNPNSPTFDFRFTDSEGDFEEDIDSTEPISTYTIDSGIEMVGTSITVEATVEDIDGRAASLAIDTDAIELPPTIPEITAIEFTGNLNPGQEIQVIPEYIGGEAPYTIQYEFIDQNGTVLQSGSSDSSYTIQVADLGKALAVKVIVTDVYGRSSEEITGLLGEVVTTISLDITTDVDNDEKADIYDDEVKVQSPDVPAGKLLPKWFMKYRG